MNICKGKVILALVIIVIIAIAAVAAFELSSKPAPSAEARNIKIGLVAPISGSPIGQDMERAAKLAVQEINDAGGISCFRLEHQSKHHPCNR